MRCRRDAPRTRGEDLNIPAPPKTSTVVIDDEGGFFAAARLAELDASSARGLLRVRLEEHRDAECLSLLDDSLKRCAIYDEAPYLVDHVDAQRNASALKLIEDASKQMDTERLRNALLNGSSITRPSLTGKPRPVSSGLGVTTPSRRCFIVTRSGVRFTNM